VASGHDQVAAVRVGEELMAGIGAVSELRRAVRVGLVRGLQGVLKGFVGARLGDGRLGARADALGLGHADEGDPAAAAGEHRGLSRSLLAGEAAVDTADDRCERPRLGLARQRVQLVDVNLANGHRCGRR